MKIKCRYSFITVLLLMMSSCHFSSHHKLDGKQDSKDDVLISFDEKYLNVEIKNMVNPDTLIFLAEEYPLEMDVYKNLLCIIMAKTDTCIHIFDKQNGELKSRLGILGQGPKDVISPEFVKNNYVFKYKEKGLMLYDLNAQRQFCLNSTDSLSNFSILEEQYNGVASLNIGADYAVGRQLRGAPLLFQILGLKNNESKSIDLNPVLPESVIDPVKDKLGFLYSANMLCNFDRNSIIVSMYYFDLLQIYDLDGSLQKTIFLEPDYNAANKCAKMFEKEDYIGYSQCYATHDYCYFCRNLINGKTRKAKKSQIIQLDWNGNIKAILDLKGQITSGFCIDNDKYLYCMEQSVIHEEEVYMVLRYDIS